MYVIWLDFYVRTSNEAKSHEIDILDFYNDKEKAYRAYRFFKEYYPIGLHVSQTDIYFPKGYGTGEVATAVRTGETDPNSLGSLQKKPKEPLHFPGPTFRDVEKVIDQRGKTKTTYRKGNACGDC